MSKSSHKPPVRILGVISATRAERMLTEWVNTDLWVEREPMSEDANACARLGQGLLDTDAVGPNWDRFHQQMEMAAGVAEYLREAWDAPDMRRFEWYTWRAQHEYEWEAACAATNMTPSHMMPHPEDEARTIAAILQSNEPAAVVTPVEAAIFHLRRNRNRALHCPNTECPAPYFFATKKGQRFCSLECAKPSQRESKRRWWAENRAKKVPKTRVSDRRSK